MFFTRIPIPFKLPYSEQIMNASQKYYAWVGLVVGAIGALVFAGAQWAVGMPIAIIMSMAATILLTGAFHEDGFTDVCDSFGGGYGKDKIMHIMKDSRIGAYGSIGIALLLLLKFYCLLELSHLATIMQWVTIYIFAHAASRFISGTTIYTHQYVRDIDSSKSKPMASQALPISALAVGCIGLLLPIVLTQDWKLLLALPLAYASKMYLAWYFQKHIGGYTGDCLGTIQQIAEVVIYLSAIVLCKFM